MERSDWQINLSSPCSVLFILEDVFIRLDAYKVNSYSACKQYKIPLIVERKFFKQAHFIAEIHYLKCELQSLAE